MFFILYKHEFRQANVCYNHNLGCIKSAYLSSNFQNFVQVVVNAYSVTLGDVWSWELYYHLCIVLFGRVW